MKIKLLAVGKTDNKHLASYIEEYLKRLTHYISFEIHMIPDVKNAKTLTYEQLKQREGEALLKYTDSSDIVILLDENGTHFTSENFSKHLQKKMNSGVKQVVFIIGGAFGFSDEIYNRSQEKIALSSMTFSHQMVRLFFVEQLYRAFTILKNEPYHHK